VKLFFRVIVFFIVSAIIPGILLLIPLPEHNYILRYFIQWNLALFMAGFSCTKFVPIAYHKLGLEIEGDFFQLRKRTLEKLDEKSLGTRGP